MAIPILGALVILALAPVIGESMFDMVEMSMAASDGDVLLPSEMLIVGSMGWWGTRRLMVSGVTRPTQNCPTVDSWAE